MPTSRTRRERGFVLVTMAVAALAIVGALGMAVDVGRAFIAKNETQTFCDSAAYAAVLKLDGTSTGIANAMAAVTNSKNNWNMDTVSIANPIVDFATSNSGPWSTNPSPATGFIYARVQTSVDLSMYFVPIVINWVTQNPRYSQTVKTAAIAGQIPQTTFDRGLAPYTVVSTQPGAPDFGLVRGAQYDIQWPNYNGSRAGCDPILNPDGCFVRPPCSGDSAAARGAVAQNWGASLSGYWGSNSNSQIDQEVLDNVQTVPIHIGENIFSILTSGNKNAEAVALDTRVQEDGDYSITGDGGVSDLIAYYANTNSNYRRFIAVPVVDPTNTSTTTVLGYASFFLLSDGRSNTNRYQSGTGNDPYCAVYAGAYVQDGSGPPANTGAGAFTVALVQ